MQGRWKTRSAISFIALAPDLITSTNLLTVDVLGTQLFCSVLWPAARLSDRVTEFLSTGSGCCAADPAASDGSDPISTRREGLAFPVPGYPVLFAEVASGWGELVSAQLLAEQLSLVCRSV